MADNHARRSRLLVAAALAVGLIGVGRWPVSPAQAKARHHGIAKHLPKDVAASFETFCADWMKKVWARETQENIKWQKDASGVQGRYVEYSRKYICRLGKGKPPVGKVDYQEFWYERRGKTIPDAQRSPPQPLETFDTAEYFTFIKGRWR